MTPLSFASIGLAGLAVTLPAHSEALAGTVQPGGDSSESVRAGLAVILSAGAPDGPGALEDDVVALGPPVVPVVLEALAFGAFDVPSDDGSSDKVAVHDDQQRALETALHRFGGEAVRSSLYALEDGLVVEQERRLIVRLLGAHGQCGDLDLLLRNARPPEVTRTPASDRAAFQGSLAELVGRQTCGTSRLRDFFTATPVDLIAGAARALGAENDAHALDRLAAVLGTVPEADPLVIAELHRAGQTVRQPIDQGTRAAVRRYLHGSGPELTMIALATIATFGDHEAMADCVDLLEHRESAVAAAAATTLRALTGVDRGSSAKRWQEWHLDAREWWIDRAPGFIEEIRRGEPGDASAALLEVSKWTLYRHELAPTVALALRRTEPELVEMSCAVLGHLGSWSAAPDLLDCVESGSTKGIRLAAVLALQRISGEKHGADAALWRATIYPQAPSDADAGSAATGSPPARTAARDDR